ncbi:MAG: PD40 domain-containing protein [Comamonadaceae bacterium]|nr:PD40 domain-containing protein [Comamonadaceae bacterium]
MVSLTSADVPPAATPQYSDAQAAVTPDGRYVVFEGIYDGLVSSPVVSGGNSQIYLRDRVAGTTELISQSTAGVPANNNDNDRPTISNDGCRVVFQSRATNLINGTVLSSSHVFLRDRCALGGPKTTQVDVMPDGSPGLEQALQPRISGDGRTVVFTSYSDLVNGLTLHNGGACTGTPGYQVVYLRHLDSNTTTALTRPDGGCIEGNEPDISYDGTRIAFWAYDDLLNRSASMWQIYLFDTSIGPSSLRYVSADKNGVPQRRNDGAHGGEGTSTVTAPAISQDGRIVAFRSRGHGLWPNPLPLLGTDVASQVYVKDTYTGTIVIASVDSTENVLGNGNSSGGGQGYRPGLSADGQYIVFRTEATNIASETGSGFVIHNNFFGGTSGLTNIPTNGFPELSPSGRFLTIHSGSALDSRFTTRWGMFLLDIEIPFAPTLTKLTLVGRRITLDFTPSAISGAVLANNYSALCEGSDGINQSATGTASPLTVAGLKSGVTYICSVVAVSGSGDPSAYSNMLSKKVSIDLTPILMLLLD